MKKYFIFPLVLASFAFTDDIVVEFHDASNAEPIVTSHEEADQENVLTIYKTPDFISKWNSQFVEVASEEIEE